MWAQWLHTNLGLRNHSLQIHRCNGTGSPDRLRSGTSRFPLCHSHLQQNKTLDHSVTWTKVYLDRYSFTVTQFQIYSLSQSTRNLIKNSLVISRVNLKQMSKVSETVYVCIIRYEHPFFSKLTQLIAQEGTRIFRRSEMCKSLNRSTPCIRCSCCRLHILHESINLETI